MAIQSTLPAPKNQPSAAAAAIACATSTTGSSLSSAHISRPRACQKRNAVYAAVITATGARLRELASSGARSLLLVRIEERLDGYSVLWDGEGTSLATSELPAHLEVHGFLRKNGSPYSAVVHTHPTHLIALTQIESLARGDALNQLLWSMHPEVKVFLPEGVGFAPYRCPGSSELAAATVEALRDHRLCLWEKHGCVCVGRDLTEAFDLIDTADKAAQIYLLCRGAGQEPQWTG